MLNTLSIARAQQLPQLRATDYRQTHMATPYYNDMARQALQQRPARFDFMGFRSYYARTRQYDPIGTQTLKELNDLAYIVMNDPDPERVQTALFGFKTLVRDHLAHIDIVVQALLLARQDRRFGDPRFYEWMKEGLINTVIISGDGYTLGGAYDVITLSEETILFNRLGFRKQHVQAAKEGIIYYNMYDVIDKKSGEKRAVFVNTSIPLKYLDALKTEQQKIFSPELFR